MHYLRLFLSACYICQLFRNDKPPSKQLETRINLNYRPMSRLSMDLKVMPRLQKGHWYILCIIDEMTNYLITMPLYQTRSEEVGESFNQKCYHQVWYTTLHDDGSGQCIYVILDELLVQKVGNHYQDSRSLQPQVITGRTWYKVFVKHTIQMFDRSRTTWHKFLSLASFTYNIFHSPNLGNYSPMNLCMEENQE